MNLLSKFFGDDTDTEPQTPDAVTEIEVDSTPDLEMDVDDVLSLISNERRRVVIQILSRAGYTLTKRDLVNHVAAHEYRQHPRRLGADQRKRVHVALHQTHLPILDEADVLDFDPTGIKPNREVDALADIIESVADDVQGGDT